MKKKKIYLADDDPAILESFAIILREKGYDTKTANNGKELEVLLSKENPDLVVLDYFMPGKNARLLTRDIRQNTRTGTVPIIVVSANSKYRSKALLAGANSFIDKPIDIDYFLSTIAKLIE